MSLYLLIAFYLIIAGCEIGFPKECLYLFEKLIGSAKRIRLLSILVFFVAFLYYTAAPSRLQLLITVLSWVYLLSGVWFATHPQSFISLCRKGYANLTLFEKRKILYMDCGMRTIIALLLAYAI